MALASRIATVTFDMFFDRAGVVARLDAKERRLLGILGAYYMTVVRRSMRNGNLKRGAKSSLPGQPPRYHTKELRDSVVFGLDPHRNQVVVGVGRYRSKVPEILEYGGTSLIKGRPVAIRPRPFIGETSINYPKAIAKLRELTRRLEL